jgi:hypothetical protein
MPTTWPFCAAGTILSWRLQPSRRKSLMTDAAHFGPQRKQEQPTHRAATLRRTPFV